MPLHPANNKERECRHDPLTIQRGNATTHIPNNTKKECRHTPLAIQKGNAATHPLTINKERECRHTPLNTKEREMPPRIPNSEERESRYTPLTIKKGDVDTHPKRYKKMVSFFVEACYIAQLVSCVALPVVAVFRSMLDFLPTSASPHGCLMISSSSSFSCQVAFAIHAFRSGAILHCLQAEEQ